MKRTRLLRPAAAGVGAAAVVDRLVRASAGAPGPPLGRPSSTYRWRGFDVAYTELGDPADPDLLLLHGVSAAASSNEFRRLVDALGGRYHVLAPDLPGFGRSDRPSMRYSGSLYVDFVGDFVRDVADRPTVVASSLTAAYAVAAASAPDVDLERLVLVCPTASTRARERPWLRALFATPVVGAWLFDALVSKPAIRYFLAVQGFSGPAAVDDEWVAYAWRSAHQPGARFAPASFVSGHLDLDVDLGAGIADLDVPTTVVWGRDATLPSLETGRELADRGDAALYVFEDAALLPHAEYPESFADLLRSLDPDET